MAISTPSLLVSSKNIGAATSHATASLSFVAGTYYALGAVVSRAAGVPTNPTVSGATSGTWTSLVGTTFGTIASAHKRILTRGFLAASSFSEAITFDYAGTSNDGVLFIIAGMTGVATATPVLQNLTNRADSVTSLTVTLAAFAANSLSLGFASVALASPGFSLGAGFTGLSTVSDNTIVAGLACTYQAADADYSESFSSGNAGAVGLEIAAASGSWGQQLSDKLNRLVVS